MKKENKYTITCTGEQLRLIANAVEDWHRFLSGQCELSHATSHIKDAHAMHDCRNALREHIRPYIVPELPHPFSAYGWSGGSCPNPHQRRAIAQSYGIYREILHFLALESGAGGENVYTSDTLTCEDNYPLIKIENHE